VDIRVDDYEVINRYCADRSWHDRVDTMAKVEIIKAAAFSTVYAFLAKKRWEFENRKR